MHNASSLRSVFLKQINEVIKPTRYILYILRTKDLSSVSPELKKYAAVLTATMKMSIGFILCSYQNPYFSSSFIAFQRLT